MRLMTLALVLLAVLGACRSEEGPVGTASQEGPVSDDPELQWAYEVCFAEMSAEVLADNPELPAELRPALIEGAHLSCESAVVKTCERGKDTQSCQLMLDMYKGESR